MKIGMTIDSGVYQKLVAMLASVSIVVSMVPFEVVNANSAKVVAQTVPAVVELIETLTLPEEAKGFPEAEDRKPLYSVQRVATAYSSDPWQTNAYPFNPADGSDYRDDFAELGAVYAIASNDLPLGTKVKLPELYGDTMFVVRDRMNARYTGRGRIDVYMAIGTDGVIDRDASRAAAKAFGLKSVTIEVYGK